VATPFESAQLNLKLFEMRRDPVLREARAWFLWEFNTDTLADIVDALSGERGASLRMVLGYWDMAASLVTSGAIDADSFRAAHTEIIGTFAKIQPLIEEGRAAWGEPEFLKHMESVVMGAPNAQTIVPRRREAIRAAAKKVSNGSSHS
jgi:hypothetical protein